jgi:CRP-like cAMP-binding protein
MDGVVDPHISAVSLRRIELFRDLPDEELRRLSARLRLVRAPRGTVLIRQGAAADELYIVETGQVRVLAGVGAGQRVLAMLGPGTSFGDLALLARSTWAVSSGWWVRCWWAGCGSRPRPIC